MKTIYLKISGIVQGVGFRASGREKAISLDLTGWIKNTDDYVEAVISGESDNIERFIQWAHHGPASARVEKVDINPAPAEDFGSFTIKRTLF